MKKIAKIAGKTMENFPIKYSDHELQYAFAKHIVQEKKWRGK